MPLCKLVGVDLTTIRLVYLSVSLGIGKRHREGRGYQLNYLPGP